MSKVLVVGEVKPDQLPPELQSAKIISPYDWEGPEKAKFVLLLGSEAVTAVWGKKKMSEVRGQLEPQGKAIYMATYHPSMGYYSPQAAGLIQTDLKRFTACVGLGRIPDPPKLNLHIVRSLADLEKALADIRSAKSLVLDLETTGLRPWFGKIVVYAIDTGDKQWVIPMHHYESPFPTDVAQQKVAELIHLAVAEKGKTGKIRPLVGHNAKFDALWPWVRHGTRFHFTFDTMMAHCLLDENSPHGLKHLSNVLLGAPSYDVSTDEKTGNTSLEKLARYAAYDVLYTRMLYRKFKAELAKDPALERLFKKLVMPTVRAFVKVEYRGVWLRIERMEAARAHLQKQIDELWDKLKPYDPHPDKKRKAKKKADGTRKTSVWVGSPKDVGTVLFEKLGMESIEKTAKGADSVSESVLLQLQGKHEIIRWILEWRGHTKNMTFIESWTEKVVEGRLHPTFKINGAVTGRMSCEEPNLQQVPRDPLIRTLIGAPPGWTLVEADLSQAELRVAAMLSGDRALKYIFQTGGDPHKETAEAVSGVKLDTLEKAIAKEMRKKAKAVNFGFLYGMGWKKFIEYARDNYGVHVTPKEAKALRERYFEKYQGLRPWHDKQRRVAKLNGQVRYMSGRLRHLPHIYSQDEMEAAEAERQAINSPVQGLVLDIICMSAVELDQKLTDGFHIVANVHDALLFEVRNDKLQEYLPIIKKAMVEPELLRVFNMNLTVPLDSEVQVGDWGNGQVWDFGQEISFNPEGLAAVVPF